MRARYFEYMVSYTFGSYKGNGNGSIILKFNRRINGRMLKKAKDHIEMNNKFQNVVIQNYKLLRECRS
ncbi:hypothetical protein BtBc_01675 [Bacillus thuringiensis]|uniref:Uncharacterized protein n=2 Tax=Bacillus cereus TaxID=1396 RepID=A0AAN6B7I9_BACCE|nr:MULTISPECIES: hypothetical protein [Bacillus cereus group]AGE75859.1 hypothetical protein HD73_0274 [Bacillus thuringiensis serovar kurstaki str. HD73]AHZ49112.1 hypothetical protein YBT1520_01695 [Bacillus thuringiensis serovar kurstaki str. YBT-1520]AJA17581.1 hypothetical protein BT4G5_01130 [Bacillus thuringiensis serovar galleriae]AJK43991.1 hypothetical protein BG08_5776 [Bacillus thuringiensis serovar kurstaki]EJV75189.1 hypothetical protein IG1_05241 [Bacillus cereus HD73]EOP83803.